MATIALYASKINNMPGLINDVKKSVTDYKSELSKLKNKSLQVNKSICNLDDVISTISASTKMQEDKISALESLEKESERFSTEVQRIDADVADIINEQKNDFYDEYSYLKPDSEKNCFEGIWDDCKSGLSSAAEWCKEHWKLVVTVVLVIAAIAAIVLTAGTALGPLATTLIMAAKGLIFGAAIGGIVGGTVSALTGGSFFEGFEDGAFGGAISGAITGGMGSWISGGNPAALSLGKNILIGGSADTVTSLISDFGDIAIKGENISFGEILFNAGFSFVLGGFFAGAGKLMGDRLPKIKILGINKGRGSWAHVWATQSTRSLRHGTSVHLKTILKGIGASSLDEIWSYCIEPIKNIFDRRKELWNIIKQY